jgi:hypothetical protein
MSIPRYIDRDGTPVQPILYCPSCHYAVTDDIVTQHWQHCPLCARKGKESKLVHKLNYYPTVVPKKAKLRRT